MSLAMRKLIFRVLDQVIHKRARLARVLKFSMQKQRYYTSRDVRKPVFGVSDQVQHKPGCKMLEILVLGRRGIVLSV